MRTQRNKLDCSFWREPHTDVNTLQSSVQPVNTHDGTACSSELHTVGTDSRADIPPEKLLDH